MLEETSYKIRRYAGTYLFILRQIVYVHDAELQLVRECIYTRVRTYGICGYAHTHASLHRRSSHCNRVRDKKATASSATDTSGQIDMTEDDRSFARSRQCNARFIDGRILQLILTHSTINKAWIFV